jgi:hypothetical protein
LHCSCFFTLLHIYTVIHTCWFIRSKEGSATLDAYLSHKHDRLLAKLLQPDSYRKRSSLAIVDGFAVEITEDQVMTAPSILFNPHGEWVSPNYPLQALRFLFTFIITSR